MQRTFDGDLVPSAKLPDDLVTCTVTGRELRRADAFHDCNGLPYADEEDRDDINADIVKEIIDSRDAQTVDYVESDDYAEGYIGVVGVSEARDRLFDWLTEKGYSRKDALRLVPQLGHVSNIEVHYQSSEYACYYGRGVALYSLPISEEEAYIELSDHPELQRLHADGGLEGALARYRGDAYLCERTNWNPVTRKRETIGYVEHDSIRYISSAGGCWHYVVPERLLEDALADLEGESEPE
jgi:hypothetical protein